MMDASATSTSPVSPWGKVQQPTETVCLADIMSEEIAKDLQLKEEENYLAYLAEQEKKDLQIREEEQYFRNFTEEAEKLSLLDCASGCDSDYLIAQTLQMQFDKEHDEALKRTEDKFNRASKVNISYVNYRVIPDFLSDTDEECEVDEKRRDWDSFVGMENALKSMPKCGYRKQGDEMVTKHDITMSSRRNACNVMSKFPPEFQTGDAGGFDMQLPNKVFNSLKVHSRNEQSRRHRLHDKSERATAEMSVDPRTRVILYRLINKEILDKVNGILSTGKEAIVLHANGGMGQDCIVPKECAIKIFKTTLSEFKTRDKYIQDDYRFKNKLSKQNPRKIIHMWAEKEMHNLMKMRKFGILCPEVVILKKHLLVMSFIGENHQPASKLKEVFLKPAELTDAYQQTILAMKKLYEEAHLVHADLSEYNILWHNKQCWFIDVSQSVDRSHPKALEFLYRDCGNIYNFFQKKGVEDIKSVNELFTYVSGLTMTEGGIGALDIIQNFERNEDLLTLEQSENHYPFDYCWEKSKE